MLIRRTAIILAAMVAVLGLITSCSSDPDDPAAIQTPNPSGDGEKNVTLSVTPSSVPADGVSSVEIVAHCTVNGDPAPAGLPVEFTTTHGVFSNNGVEPLGGGVQRATSRTTSGQATVYLISPTTVTTGEVKAVFASEIQVTRSINFTVPNTAVAVVTVEVNPDSGEGPLNAQVEATVTDKAGNGLEGVQVIFSINDPQAVIQTTRVTTDTAGKAFTSISAISRDSVVTATAQGHNGTAAVDITNDAVKTVSLKAVNYPDEPVIINEAGELLLEATINGESGPVIGVPVTFSSSVGSTSFSDNNVKTDSNGTVQVYASNIMRNTTITATAAGISDTLSIVVNNPPIAVITLIQGTPETKRVNSLTFSAENSYDPDQSYGDSIETFTWGYSYKGEAPVPVQTSNTTNSQIITFQIGDPTGETPDRGDVFTVILTVVDENGLQDTETYVITFL